MTTKLEQTRTIAPATELNTPTWNDSAELGQTLNGLERAERQARDRLREQELARLRPVQSFD